MVDEVGTIPPGPASLTSGIKILISDARYKREFFFETTPINVIFLFLKMVRVVLLSVDNFQKNKNS